MSAFSLRMYLLEGRNLFYSHIFPVGPSPEKFLNKTYPAIGSTHLFYQAANHSPIYSPVYPSIHKSNHPCIFWYIQTSIHPSAYSCIHIHSPMHTSTYHIFIYPFIYPPINLSIHQHHTQTPHHPSISLNISSIVSSSKMLTWHLMWQEITNARSIQILPELHKAKFTVEMKVPAGLKHWEELLCGELYAVCLISFMVSLILQIFPKFCEHG